MATVTSTKVSEHNVFEIQFELQNANGDQFEPPSFKGFRIAGGPATGSSTTIINGKVSRSESWSYSLIAPTAGTYTIGPATVIAGRPIGQVVTAAIAKLGENVAIPRFARFKLGETNQ